MHRHKVVHLDVQNAARAIRHLLLNVQQQQPTTVSLHQLVPIAVFTN